jgi:hypothetical protein
LQRQPLFCLLKLLQQPVLLADALDQLELRLAPVHILFLVLIIRLEDIKGGVVISCFFRDLMQPSKTCF